MNLSATASFVHAWPLGGAKSTCAGIGQVRCGERMRSTNQRPLSGEYTLYQIAVRRLRNSNRPERDGLIFPRAHTFVASASMFCGRGLSRLWSRDGSVVDKSKSHSWAMLLECMGGQSIAGADGYVRRSPLPQNCPSQSAAVASACANMVDASVLPQITASQTDA